MTTLGPALDKLERLLIDAKGSFVPGIDLASATGVPMIALSNFIGQLRTKRRALVIEGKRGKGYRVAESPTPASKSGPKSNGEVLPTNQRVAATATLLDMLRPQTAELVKKVTLDSGEPAESCIARLIAYGAEVHTDLVSSGENPLGLTTPRASIAATRH